MLLITGLVLAALIVAHFRVDLLDQKLAIGLDVLMVFTLFCVLLLLLAWVVWTLAFSRWRWFNRILVSAVLVSLPVIFFTVFRPVHGGDVNFLGFEPIWRRRPSLEPPMPTVAAAAVDLTTESPFDFPRFLGPDQDGTVRSGVRIDAVHFADSKLLWKQPIGRGWSGFSARNGFAVTMEQREGMECVTCYSVESGELMWTYQTPTRHQDKMNLGRTGPRSTPTIADGHVYSVGALGHLACLDGSNGQAVWTVDLNSLLGISLETVAGLDGVSYTYESNTTLDWGRSGSPLVYGDLVVVPGGGPKSDQRATLLAFDRQTGELRWRGGDEMIAYGSPVLKTVAGREQILLVAETQAMGFDPENGDVLWTFSRPGESNGAANTSQLTVVSEDRLLTTKGYPDGGGRLFEVRQDGDAFRIEQLWRNDSALKTKMMSPVVKDGYAWALSNAFLECVRLEDGHRMWKARGRFGHGQLLLVGEHLLLHSETGRLHLIEASPEEFREISSFPTIDGVCWNTLCLMKNRLLVRSEVEAACFELP